MEKIFTWFTLGCLLTLQIFLFYEINRIENMLVLTLAGMPLNLELTKEIKK